MIDNDNWIEEGVKDGSIKMLQFNLAVELRGKLTEIGKFESLQEKVEKYLKKMNFTLKDGYLMFFETLSFNIVDSLGKVEEIDNDFQFMVIFEIRGFAKKKGFNKTQKILKQSVKDYLSDLAVEDDNDNMKFYKTVIFE